jgi:O-methyltransferase
MVIRVTTHWSFFVNNTVRFIKSLIPSRVKVWLKQVLFEQSISESISEHERNVQKVLRYLQTRVPVTVIPTYAGDSLVSWHNAEFLSDPTFIRAYEAAVVRNSWDLNNDIRWRIHVLLWAAQRAAQMEGDFVECGVNRGGFSRAVIEYLDFEKLDKSFYLMDTFEGLVEKYISPEERAMGISRDHFSGYTDCFADVQEAFRPFPNVKLIRGPIPDTLPQSPPKKICYLSIDMNTVIPEIAAAEYFWDKLVSGAVIILDDYGHYLHINQKHAFDNFAIKHAVQVLMLPTGQGLIFKP